MRKAGLVTAEKRGVWAYYKLSSPIVQSMIGMADEIAKSV